MKQATRTFTAAGVRTTGFTLVELMIAITLGLLLTAGMIQMFSATRITFNSNEALSRVQENGRFAMELLKRELRPTGDTGFCGGDLRVRNHLDSSCSGFTESVLDQAAITGYEYTGSGTGDTLAVPTNLDPATAAAGDWSSNTENALPDDLAGLVVPGSDVIVVRTAVPVPDLTADDNNQPGANSITTNQEHGLDTNEIVFVTNCATGADLFQNVHGGTGGGGGQENANTLAAGNASCSNPGPGNLNSGCTTDGQPGSCDWMTAYDDSMQLFRQRVRAYYIGVNANGRPGLFQRRLFVGASTPPPEELVEGAENMQVLYGFSNQGSAGGDGQSVDSWATADSVPDEGFEQVIAVRIAVLMRSPERADGDRTDQNFELFSEQNGLTITLGTTGDGRIRLPFTTAVALRNQMLVFD